MAPRTNTLLSLSRRHQSTTDPCIRCVEASDFFQSTWVRSSEKRAHVISRFARQEARRLNSHLPIGHFLRNFDPLHQQLHKLHKADNVRTPVHGQDLGDRECIS